MAAWAKFKFYWDTVLGDEASTLEATSTESTGDFSVDYIHNGLETNFWKAANTTTPMYIALTPFGSNIVLNDLFENVSLGTGDPDEFDDWIDSTTNGAITAETTFVFMGTYSCKLTQGATFDTKITQDMTVTPGQFLKLRFWTRGDGTNAGEYQVLDVTHGTGIIAQVTTGITGTTYTGINVNFTIPAGTTTIRVAFFPADVNGADAYFDNITIVPFAGQPVVDYLAIIGHNLYTIGAEVTLQYSNDNFSSDINDAFTGEVPTADTVFLKEFTQQTQTYWRLKIDGTLSVAPFLAIAIWGETTELDYASASFDPHSQDEKAIIGRSQNGFVSGVHTRYIERRLTIAFNDADDTLYQKVKAWRETNGMKNFFVSWDTANNPNEVWLMQASPSFSNPYTETSEFRNIRIDLTGRKE